MSTYKESLLGAIRKLCTQLNGKFAKKSDVPSKVSQLANDKGYLDRDSTISEGKIAAITGATEIPPLARALIDNCRANKLAFLPADQIIVEKTVDGGKTWTDAGISDEVKATVFSGVQYGAFPIPHIDGKMNTLCGLRITFTAMKYNVPAGTKETDKYKYWTKDYVKSQERYCALDYFWFWLVAVNNAISVRLESATGTSPNNWVTRYDGGLRMTGWSGPNIIKTEPGLFGGGAYQPNNYWNYRFTCMTVPRSGQTKLNTGYETEMQKISAIRGYGDRTWDEANNLMNFGTVYSVDLAQNTTFPARVHAPAFVEDGKLLSDIYAKKTELYPVGSIITSAVAIAPASLYEGTWAAGAYVYYQWGAPVFQAGATPASGEPYVYKRIK